MIKKILFSLVTCLSFTLLAGCVNQNDDIVILFTNDIHCSVDENITLSGVGGYKKTLQNKYKYVSLIDSGDATEGSALGTISKGEVVVKIMNEVGYDFCAIGNHEFNYGTDRLKELIQMSNATYLNANITYDGNKENWIEKLDKYKIVNYGNIKVGYIGITTPFTLSSIAPTLFMEDNKLVYHFDFGGETNLYNNIQNQIDQMKAEGANYVIALSHFGQEGHSLEPYSAKDLATKTSGIDIIIDGHSHTEYIKEETNKKGNKVMIAQTGSNLNRLGQIIIKQDGGINICTLNGKFSVDSQLDKKIKDILSEYNEFLKTKVGSSNIDFPFTNEEGKRIAYLQESSLGDFVSDSIKYSTNAQISFLNGGGIRAGLSKGDITYNDILNLCPFNNDIDIINLTGQQILDMFEYFNYKALVEENGSLPQASGVTYTVDTTKPYDLELDAELNLISVGKNRRIKDFKVFENGNYVPINPDSTYVVSSINYILSNGGCGMIYYLQNIKPTYQAVIKDNQALIDYVTYLNGDLSMYSTANRVNYIV